LSGHGHIVFATPAVVQSLISAIEPGLTVKKTYTVNPGLAVIEL